MEEAALAAEEVAVEEEVALPEVGAHLAVAPPQAAEDQGPEAAPEAVRGMVEYMGRGLASTPAVDFPT